MKPPAHVAVAVGRASPQTESPLVIDPAKGMLRPGAVDGASYSMRSGPVGLPLTSLLGVRMCAEMWAGMLSTLTMACRWRVATAVPGLPATVFPLRVRSALVSTWAIGAEA